MSLPRIDSPTPADDSDDGSFLSINSGVATLKNPASSSVEIDQVIQRMNYLLSEEATQAHAVKALLQEECMQAVVNSIAQHQGDDSPTQAITVLKGVLTHPFAAESATPTIILPRFISIIQSDSANSKTRADIMVTLRMIASSDHQRRDELISSELIDVILPNCTQDTDPRLLFATVDLLLELWASTEKGAISSTQSEKLYATLPALAEIFLTTPIDSDINHINLINLSLECCILGTLDAQQYPLLTQYNFLPRLTEVLSNTPDLELKCVCLRMVGYRFDQVTLFSYVTDHNGMNVLKQCLEKPVLSELDEDERAFEHEQKEHRASSYRLAIHTLQKFSEQQDSIPFLVEANVIHSLLPHLIPVHEYDPLVDHKCLLLGVRLLSNICGAAVDQIPHAQAAECVETLVELLNTSSYSALIDQVCSTLIPLSLEEHQPVAFAMLQEAAQVEPPTTPPGVENNEEEEEEEKKPRQSLIHRLIDLMQSSQLSLWTMRLIQNLSEGNPEHLSTALTYKNGLMLKTVHLVLQHENPKFREVAMWLVLGPATEGTAEDIQCMLDSGIVKVVLQMMRNEETNIQMMALSTLSHLVMKNQNVTPEQRAYFFNPVPAVGDETPHCGIDILTFLFHVIQTTTDGAYSVCITWIVEYLITRAARADAIAAGAEHTPADVTTTLLSDPATLAILHKWNRMTLRRVTREDLEDYHSVLGPQSSFRATSERILTYGDEVKAEGIDLGTCDGEDATGILRASRLREADPEAPVRTIDEIQALQDALPSELQVIADVSERLPRLVTAADAVRRAVMLTTREGAEKDPTFDAIIQSSIQRVLDADILPRLVQLFDTTESEVLQYHTLYIITRIVPPSLLDFTYSFLPLLLNRIRTSNQTNNIELMSFCLFALHKLDPPGIVENPVLVLEHFRKLASETSVIKDLFEMCQAYSDSTILYRVIIASQAYLELPLRDMTDYSYISGFFKWAARTFSYATHQVFFTRVASAVQEFVTSTLADFRDGTVTQDVIEKMHEDVKESGIIPHLLRMLHHPNDDVSKQALLTLTPFIIESTGAYASYLLSEEVGLLDVFTPFLAVYSMPTQLRTEICRLTYAMIFHWAAKEDRAEILIKNEDLMIRVIRNVRFARNYAPEEKDEDEEEETEEEKQRALVKQDEQHSAAIALCSFLNDITETQFTYFIRTYQIVPALCRTLMYQCEDHPDIVLSCMNLIKNLVHINQGQFLAELVESSLHTILGKLMQHPNVTHELKTIASQMFYGWFIDSDDDDDDEKDHGEAGNIMNQLVGGQVQQAERCQVEEVGDHDDEEEDDEEDGEVQEMTRHEDDEEEEEPEDIQSPPELA